MYEWSVRPAAKTGSITFATSFCTVRCVRESGRPSSCLGIEEPHLFWSRRRPAASRFVGYREALGAFRQARRKVEVAFPCVAVAVGGRQVAVVAHRMPVVVQALSLVQGGSVGVGVDALVAHRPPS